MKLAVARSESNGHHSVVIQFKTLISLCLFYLLNLTLMLTPSNPNSATIIESQRKITENGFREASERRGRGG